MNPFKQTIAALLFGAAVSAAFAAESLFDFSVSDGGWKSTAKRDVVKRSAEYPAEGKQGLLFCGPEWKGGPSVWPAFETRSLPVKEWSRYDRLAVPVYNDSAAEMVFNIFISDSKKPLRQGAHFAHMLSPYSSKQLVLPLKQAFAGKGVDPADISVIHCYTENPENAMRFFIGGFTLLPDWDLSQAMGQEFAGLVLIGGKSWRTKEAEQVEPLVRRAREKGAVLAGICDASVYLGTLGMLNDADHTSNQMADLQNYAGDRYTGALRYQNRQAVRDGKLVTANGTAHMEFAREVLLALDVMPPDAVEQWYRFYKMGYYLAMGL